MKTGAGAGRRGPSWKQRGDGWGSPLPQQKTWGLETAKGFSPLCSSFHQRLKDHFTEMNEVHLVAIIIPVLKMGSHLRL